MAQVIRFFARQSIAGAVGQNIYSDVFEVPDVAQVVTELRCYAISAAATAAVTGFIEDCMTQQLDPSAWRGVGTAQVSAVNQASMVVVSQLQRFIRARIVPGGTVSSVILSFEGVGREST